MYVSQLWEGICQKGRTERNFLIVIGLILLTEAHPYSSLPTPHAKGGNDERNSELWKQEKIENSPQLELTPKKVVILYIIYISFSYRILWISIG